jgi:hypothetical protein
MRQTMIAFALLSACSPASGPVGLSLEGGVDAGGLAAEAPEAAPDVMAKALNAPEDAATADVAEAGISCAQCAYHGVCQTWDYANAVYNGCGAAGRCVAEWASVVCPNGCQPSVMGSCQ